jgi:hypothetical protein
MSIGAEKLEATLFPSQAMFCFHERKMFRFYQVIREFVFAYIGNLHQRAKGKISKHPSKAKTSTPTPP